MLQKFPLPHITQLFLCSFFSYSIKLLQKDYWNLPERRLRYCKFKMVSHIIAFVNISSMTYLATLFIPLNLCLHTLWTADINRHNYFCQWTYLQLRTLLDYHSSFFFKQQLGAPAPYGIIAKTSFSCQDSCMNLGMRTYCNNLSVPPFTKGMSRLLTSHFPFYHVIIQPSLSNNLNHLSELPHWVLVKCIYHFLDLPTYCSL